MTYLTLKVGALVYNKMPAAAFDTEWEIGNEPALRWFCRACYTRNELTDHQACGSPSYDPKRETVTRRDYMLDVNSGEFNSKTNGVYFTPNLFYRWRNQKHLNGLVAHWLEIDVKGHRALTEAESKRILDEVADVLGRSGLPNVTSLVTTGSGGLHLYWMYNKPQMTQSAKHREKLIERWREISKRISSRFEEVRQQVGYKDWEVDLAASHNPSGNMRLPSSLHHKTWREVEYYQGGKKFEPQRLVDALGLKWRFPLGDGSKATQEIRKSRPTPLPRLPAKSKTHAAPPPKTVGVAQGFDSSGQQYWMKGLLQQLSDYLAMTKPDLRGKRDLTAFQIYNMANRVMGVKEAWDYIVKINKAYIGLADSELKAYLSAANKTVYYYGMRRLSYILGTELGFPLDFSCNRKAKTLNAKEVTRRRSRAGRVSSSTKREKTLDKLVRELNTFIEERRVTPTQISGSQSLRATFQRSSSLAKATFYRHLKSALQKAMRKHALTLMDLRILTSKVSLIRSPFSYNAVGDSALFFSKGFISKVLFPFIGDTFGVLRRPPD